MKKRILAIVLILSLVMSMMPGMAFASTTTQNYELRTLTFEDSDYKGGQNFAGGTNWTSLVDSPQYGGTLLYGEGFSGFASEEESYKWSDRGNTELSHVLPNNYDTYCYWGGGHAISNYTTGEYATYGDYEHQLSVYKKDVEGVQQTGGGHNGSNNFAVHFGYIDGSPYNMTEYLPSLHFADGEARIIDHMYVNSMAYFLNCAYNGNELTDKIGENDYVYLEATGYHEGEKTGSVKLPIVDGTDYVLTEWTKWDLSGLGPVTSVDFNICGSSDNGFGFSQAAYFAYDDVAVRFPKADPIVPTAVNLNKETAELNVGDTMELDVTVEPEGAQVDSITWTSTDEAVATVKDGTVTALAAGKTTIKAQMGDLSASCELTVVKVNQKPVLKEGVSATKTDVVPVSYGYSLKELQNNKVFEDPDGDELNYTSYYYERSTDGGQTWSAKQGFSEAAFGDTVISLMERKEGTYMYRFYAYDGQAYSDDTYTVTLIVSNDAPLNFTFHVGQDYTYNQTTQPNYPIIKLYKTAGTDAAKKDYVGWYEKENGEKVYIYNPADHVIAGDAETGYTADGYDLKGYEPIAFTDSLFGEEAAEGEAATISGTIVENNGKSFNTFYASAPAGKYSYRAYGYNTESSSYDIYLGGQQLILPTETNVDGGMGGGTDIYIGIYSAYTTSKKTDNTYFTANEYDVEIMMPKMESQVHHGAAYQKGNYAYYPFAIYTAGNSALFNVKSVPKLEGYMFSQIGNQTRAANDKAYAQSITIGQRMELSVTVPIEADFGLYYQWNNFNTEEVEASAVTKNESKGTKTISYGVTKSNGNYTWRLTDPNGEYVTRAGWLTKLNTNEEIEFSFESKEVKSHDFTKLGTAVIKRDEGDIQVFVSDSGFKSTTDTYRARAYRMWEIINSDSGNIMIEPDFNVQVLSGNASDIVKVNGNNAKNNWIDVTPTTTDIVAVNYNALDVDSSNNASHGGFFPATSPERTNVFVMTNEAAGTADAHILYATDGKTATTRSDEWDYNYDTWFYMNTDTAPSLDFTVEGTGNVKVSYATVTTNTSLISTLSDWQDVTVGEDGECTIDLTPFKTANTKGGTVIIKMTDETGTSYRLARVAEMSVQFENVSNPGEPLMLGEDVKVTFEGLYRSINKISGIFNPTTYKFGYYNNDVEVQGALGQYQKMDSTTFTFTIPEDVELGADEKGTYTFTNGYVYGQMYSAADPFTSMYYITDSGVGTNFNAVNATYFMNHFPDITVDVVKKVVYDVNLHITDGKTTVSDANITLTDSDGNVVAADENGIYQDLGFGEYQYAVKAKGYVNEYGSFRLSSADKDAVAEGILTKAIEITKAGETAWDGSSLSTPKKDENGIYQIGTGAELAWFAALVNGTLEGVTADTGASAVLTADIDLAAHEWTPIGATAYSGTFDGQGHKIKNLSIRYSGTTNAINQGLFYKVTGTKSAPALIKNFTVEGNMLLASTASVSMANSAGVVGSGKYVTIENVYADVNITIQRTKGNWQRVGGIIGSAEDGVVVKNCMNTGDINGYQSLAGIVGYGSKADMVVSGCVNTGNIRGNSYVAGIGGYIYGEITSCYNEGEISGNSNSGGIVGYLAGLSANVNYCFNLGDVMPTGTTTASLGAVIGAINNKATITDALYYLEGTNANGIGTPKDAETQTATAVSIDELTTVAFLEKVNKEEGNPTFVMDTDHPVLLWQISPEKNYQVIVPENPAYVVSGASSTKVGVEYSFTVTTADGYHIVDVKVNGRTVIANQDGTYTVPFVVSDLTITAEAHELTYHKAVGSTCTTDGTVAYYACSVCEKNYADEAGKTVLESIVDVAHGHKMTYHKAVGSTCTTDGTVAYYACSVCEKNYADEAGKTVLESIVDPADGHKMTYHKAVASTCTTDGTVAYYACSVCEKNYADEAGKTVLESIVDVADGHQMTYHKAVAATCTTDGTVAYYACSVCEKNYADEAGKTVLDSIVDVAHGHKMTYHKAIASTCTADGTVAYYACSVCEKNYADEAGKTVLESIVDVAHGHKMTYHKAVGSTCITDGTVAYYACSVCEKNYADEAGKTVLESIVDAADGHKMTYHKAVSSTCTADGTVAYYACSVCEKNYADEAGKTVLESIVDEADGHKMTSHKAVASTCTTDGTVAYYACSVCEKNYADEAGKTVLESIVDEADGHKYTSKVVKATTSAKGYTLHTCSACNSSYKDAYTKQLLKTPIVKATNVASSGKVKLSWSKVTGAEQYKVYRATSKNGKYTLLKTVRGTSFTNTSAKAGNTYYYKVKAVDTNKKLADSAYSKIAKATCDLKRPAVTAKSKTKKQVKLTWKKVSGAKKYVVYRATSKNGKYTKIATTTKTSFANKKLKSGKTYYYKVKAIAKNSAANSAFSLVDKCKVR